jgi:two-component system response regulator PilR (NtrC family)
MRDLLSILLRKEGYEVTAFEDAASALEATLKAPPDLVIQDLKMPGMDGIELLEKIREAEEQLPVIIITAFGSWDTAVTAMRLGAYDYIRKPFDNESIRTVVSRAIEQRRLAKEGGPGTVRVGFENIIGNSPAVQSILNLITRVAATDSTILITGESGTGKELFARAIHFHSLRSAGPFITVNCGAFTESLLESELFGHVKGAFTGAYSDKKGLFDVAQKGTFFLDEAGDLSATTQMRLLRVLEERRFIPVGSTREHHVDVRFIAATNRDLAGEVAGGRFREDLFYRLNVIPIEVKPLRERKEDIPLLAGHFLAVYAGAMGKNVTGFSKNAIKQLMANDWPGNVRELENVIQRTVAMSDDTTINRVVIAGLTGAHAAQANVLPSGGINIEDEVEKMERAYIEQALARTNGNLTKAADLLGTTFRSLRYKVKKLGLKRTGVVEGNDTQ